MQPNERVPADEIEFEEFCVLLKQLQKKAKQRQEQDTLLRIFFNDIRFKFAKITGKKNSSLFPMLRLLLPHRDRERKSYNLKEKRLGEVLVKVLSLPKQSQDAQKLLNFRSVQNTSNDSDFAGVAYFVLKNRISQKTSSLTIGDVNGILDKIAPEEGHKTNLDLALSYAFKRLTVEQLRWFLRIILKDMKLRMSEHRLLAAFHPDAPDLFDNCADLKKVCEEFADGDSRPLELGVQIFFAISPMLSERLNITQILKLLPEKSYVIEEKFDGERFQMHMENDEFEYFSRKGYKYADNYGNTYESGLLTPNLKGCFSENVKSIILDGEMMGWNKQYQYFGSKGMAFDVKKLTAMSTYQPCFCVFDVLFYNGKPLVGPPEKGGLSLKERLKILDAAFSTVLGVIQHSERKPVTDSGDILNSLNAAIENQAEGIVIKDVDSYYIANKRNAGWYKIKPEYTEGTMTDLDLVIVGADEAENKRQGRAKSFHIACLDTANGEQRRWVCVGRVASGLTYAEREELCAALEKHWAATRRVAPPACLYFNKEKPDLWLLPDHSIVLQVRATELIRSKNYGAEYTLRFPRIMRIRKDKPVADVMTLEEFHQLASSKAPVVKLTSKRVSADQIGDGSNIDVKVLKKRKSNVQVAAQFRTKAAGEVLVTSHALQARKVCILSEDDDCSKEELIRIVESHGGIHVQNIGIDTWCSIAGKMTERVKHTVAQGVDVATTEWLRSLPASPSPCVLVPIHMLSLKPETKLTFGLRYDRFGDSYTEFTDEDTLRKCFDKMSNFEPPIYLTNREMSRVDEVLFGGENPYSFLRQCNMYIKKSLYALTAQMYGACLCDVTAAVLTHVIVPKDSRVEDVNDIKRKTGALILSEEWLEACFKEKKLVPYISFTLS